MGDTERGEGVSHGSVGRGGAHHVALRWRAVLLVRLGGHWPVHAGSDVGLRGGGVRSPLLASRHLSKSWPSHSLAGAFAHSLKARYGPPSCIGWFNTSVLALLASVSSSQARPRRLYPFHVSNAPILERQKFGFEDCQFTKRRTVRTPELRTTSSST